MLCSSLLGHQLGDPPAPWFDAATNTCGGILYIATGSLIVDFYTNALGPPPAKDAGLAMGSFSLITGPPKNSTFRTVVKALKSRPRRKRLQLKSVQTNKTA